MLRSMLCRGGRGNGGGTNNSQNNQQVIKKLFPMHAGKQLPQFLHDDMNQ